jgi:tetratricopeptide (TPR) repeat protein
MKSGDRGSGDLIERLRAGAQAHRRPQKTRKCPDEDRLRLLLPGQIDPAEADKLLTHAAGCDWCGTVLREAAQDLSDPPTGEEEELAAKARLADPGRRRELAERIVTKRKETGDGPWLAIWRWWPAAGLAAAGTAVASLLFQMGWLGGVPAAQRLTCRAYAEQRELPMRLMACAAYAPIHTERGTESSRLGRPDLMEAEARVARGAETHPNDPAWLHLLGRADLLDGKDDAAVAELERARALRPKDAYILSDLGMAYYQKAERKKDPQSYALAFERLSEGAGLKGNDPALLFNRALAAESLFAFTEARDYWEAYLRLDSTTGWAREARQHLEEVKKNLSGSGSMAPPQLQTR